MDTYTDLFVTVIFRFYSTSHPSLSFYFGGYTDPDSMPSLIQELYSDSALPLPSGAVGNNPVSVREAGGKTEVIFIWLLRNVRNT